METEHFATSIATNTSSVGGPKHSFERVRKPLWPSTEGQAAPFAAPFVSAVGFGAARAGQGGEKAIQECEVALENALQWGCNLIDASAFSLDGKSEELIGRVLERALASGYLRRNNVVLVGKASDPEGGAEGMVIPDAVERSCVRMGVECLDVVLLEYPERFVMDLVTDGMPLVQARELLKKYLAQSFESLGNLVVRGKIRAFGVSSGGLCYPTEFVQSVALSDLLWAAATTGTSEHFKVVSLPINWIEVGALFPYSLDPSGKSFLQIAHDSGLGVLAHRPLNAMSQGQLIRLARPRFSEADLDTLSAGEQQGLENWLRLSQDLESMARGVIESPGYDQAPLSQLVVASLTQLPEVSSVLLGMRRPRYVEDALEALTLPKLLAASNILMRLHGELDFQRA